jgi:hypothetical protein
MKSSTSTEDVDMVLLAFQLGSEAGFEAGPDWQREALATLLGWSTERVQKALDALVSTGYLEVPATYGITDVGKAMLGKGRAQ